MFLFAIAITIRNSGGVTIHSECTVQIDRIDDVFRESATVALLQLLKAIDGRSSRTAERGTEIANVLTITTTTTTAIVTIVVPIVEPVRMVGCRVSFIVTTRR